jgi:hypothetical protein
METIPLLQEADRDRLVGPGMTGATCINLLNGLAWMGYLLNISGQPPC